jgi:non-ribosomal peptide synthetase component F
VKIPNRFLVLAWSLAAALGLGVQAASGQVIWTVGIGRTSCAKALENIEQQGAAYQEHYLTWIGGFISGVNMAEAEQMRRDVRVGEGIPNSKIAALFTEKCERNPEKPLPQVAYEIRDELAESRR